MAESQPAASGAKLGGQRPLSPHLQVWRWHATMLTSILHRATGVGLYLGALAFTAWLVAISLGPAIYVPAAGLVASLPGQVVMWAVVFSACLHLLSGLRHLFWDAGHGFKKRTASFFSILIIVGACAMTAGLWYWAWSSAPQIGGLQ